MILSSQSLQAQSVPDLWARRGGGPIADIVSGQQFREVGAGIAVDANGNVIVAGSYKGPATFGHIQLDPLDDDQIQPDIFLVKYDPGGNVLWAKRAGGIFWDQATALALDANGDIVMTGSYGFSADFGNGITLDPPDGDLDEIFIAKYNKDGVTLWAKSYGGPGGHWGYGIAADAANRIFVTGFFDNRVNFPNNTLFTSGDRDIYVASFNSDGSYRWAQKAGGSQRDEGLGIAADKNGNIFVTGYFTGAANFSPSISPEIFGGQDAFVAKYNNAGAPLWAKSAGGAFNDRGNAVAADGAGNVVFTGFFPGDNCDFEGSFLSLFGESDIENVFLAKADPDGEFLDAGPGASTLIGQGRGVAIDNLDRIYVTGWFSGQADIDTDNDDDILMTSAGAEDVFFARFFSDDFDDLEPVFARNAGGRDTDQGFAIAVNPQRHVAFTGRFRGTAIFDTKACAAVDSAKIQSANNTFDMFVARHTPAAQTPDPPSNLILTPLGGPQVSMLLNWQDKSDNEEGFIIIRNDREYDRIPADVTTYQDFAVDEDDDYLYRIRAFNRCGISPSSNEEGDQTGINSPSAFTATPESSTLLHLTWRDNSAIEDGFVIERSATDQPDSYQLIATLGEDVDEFYDGGVTSRQKYYYRIYACQDCGDFPDDAFTSDPFKTSVMAAILYPTAQVNWDVGTMHRMVWSPPSPSGAMKVEYSTDDGRTWNKVTETLNDHGCFDWLVPNTPTEFCRMRVYDNANPSLYLESALFTAGKPKAPYLLATNVVGLSGQLTCDVVISQNTASINDFIFKLKFDPSHLEFAGVRNAGLTVAWPPLQVTAQSGVLVLSGVNSTAIPVLSEGVLAKIDFRIRGECGGACRVHALRFYSVRGDLNNTPFNIYNGTFSCPPPGILGDVNATGEIIPTPGDALCAHKIALFKALPADEAACNNVSAWSASDANCDGQISQGDALEIFRHYLQQSRVACSFLSKVQAAARPPGQLRLSTRAAPNEEILSATLAVRGSASISAFGLELHYPEKQLEFVELVRSPATAEWIALEGVALAPGVISMGGFHIQELRASPEAVLGEVVFKLKREEPIAANWQIDHLTDDLAQAEILIEHEQVTEMAPVPKEYGLDQNYPNPFNPSTTIAFDLPQAGPVTLAIYNLLGEKIRTLLNQPLAAGKHQAVWDGKNESGESMPSGVYHYKIEAQNFRAVKKLVLAR